MPCKLAVIRRPSGLFSIGDVVNAYDLDVYLGDLVEPVGGPYVLVEVTDADKDHEHIQKLCQLWEVENAPDFNDPNYEPLSPHPTHAREFHLRPQVAGDPFFTQLITTGRVSGTIATVIEYTERYENA